MRYLKVKNWKKHQHYKGRRPPWIKLYADVFTDDEFACLSDKSKLHLIAIWVLARLKDGVVPANPKWIRKASGLNGSIDLEPLIAKGFLFFIDDASNLPATCPSETETETDTEKREEVEETQTSAAVKRHSPVEALNPFPEKARQPALQSAIAYQIRRYGSPMPSAAWYPSLLNEAGTLFEVQDDPAKALEVFTLACRSPPNRALPRDATYSKIAEHCGLKQGRFSGPPPWEAAKEKEKTDGMAALRRAVLGEGKV